MRVWSQAELRLLGAVLVLATALRVVWVLYAAREPQGFHDPLFYKFYAERIAEGHGYRLLDGSPSAYFPIGYPAALGGVYALVKHTLIPDNLQLAAGFFNVFLGVATVALVYKAGLSLFNARVGLLAALWLAVFPNLIYHTGAYLTETLFNLLITAGLVLLLAAPWKDGRVEPWRLVAFGALLGLSALVRPISLLFLPALLIAWLAFGTGWRLSMTRIGAMLAVTAAVIAPWAIRNAVVMRAPIVISANLGDNLCIGHHPGAPGHFALPDHCFAGYDDTDHREFEVRRNNENIRKGVSFALGNPLYELRLIARKAFWLMDHDHDGLWAVESYGDDPFIDPDLRRVLSRIADVFFYVTAVAGGLGLVAFVLPPRRPRRIFFLLALLALAAVPLAFFADARFHVPAMPLLVVPAAWLVAELPAVLRRLVGRQEERADGPAAGGDDQPLRPKK